MIAARRPLSLDQVRVLAPSAFAEHPHDGVSDKYSFIPTIRMIESLTKEGWNIVQAGEHRVRNQSKKGYQKHLLRFNHPSLPRVADSEIDLLVYNSHDRTSAFKFCAGMFRFVCTNGLAVGTNLFEPISVRHFGFKADNVINASYRLIDNVPKITDQVKRFTEIPLEPQEREIYAANALSLKYDVGKMPITAVQALQVRRYDDNKNDLWSVFNRVQENLIKGQRRTWQHKATRKIGSISAALKLNQALRTLTEKMAELKG